MNSPPGVLQAATLLWRARQVRQVAHHLSFGLLARQRPRRSRLPWKSLAVIIGRSLSRQVAIRRVRNRQRVGIGAAP